MIDDHAIRLSHGELAGMAAVNNRAVFPADRFMPPFVRPLYTAVAPPPTEKTGLYSKENIWHILYN